MRKIKCIIVDDEPVARKVIREFIEQLSYLELCGEFENALKAESFLRTEKADLLFLDIEMPKISGLDWLKKTSVNPMVILTTAYPEYALEGYELDIIDYLLKPISQERFLKAAQKAKEIFELRQGNSPVSSSWIFVRAEKRIEKVEFDEILYIEGSGNYVTIHGINKKLLAHLTLKSIETQLPANLFLKVHQSYIVNISKIESIEGNQVKAGKQWLPIGRNYKDVLMKLVDEKLLKR